MTPVPSIEDLDRAPSTTLRGGRWGNATVRRVQVDGGEWIVKDFRTSPLWFRIGPARLLVGREYKALQSLAGIPGIPVDVSRMGSLILVYRYVAGETLKALGSRGVEPPAGFFPALDEVVRRMHERHRVHLDLRNARNILVNEQGLPVLLDFQASLCDRHLPRWLGELLRACDRSGVHKWWIRMSPHTCDPATFERLRSFNRVRRWWMIKGYSFGFRIRKRERLQVPEPPAGAVAGRQAEVVRERGQE